MLVLSKLFTLISYLQGMDSDTRVGCGPCSLGTNTSLFCPTVSAEEKMFYKIGTNSPLRMSLSSRHPDTPCPEIQKVT